MSDPPHDSVRIGTSGQSLTEQLAALVLEPVDDRARMAAATHLLDWVGTVVAATAVPDGATLVDHARSRPVGRASAVGAGRRDFHAAAFVNAGLSISLEADATHRGARLHPGGVTIAAALAQAEQLGSPSSQLLDAIVRGYEAMVRVGESTGAGHYVHWHTTSTCGPFGSAAAAVSLVLEARGVGTADGRATLSSALGTASSATGGLWQTREEHTPTKMVHAGQAAVAGLQAAALAAAGLRGPLAILEGPHGLYAATCPDPHPGAVTAPCRAGWKIHETSLKPWCACRHVHPAVGAALDLRAQLEARGATAGDIAAVDLYTYRDALKFANCPTPTSSRSAMFSLQHAVAVALVQGDLPLAALDEAHLADPPVAALRARVQVGTDPGLERAYPDAWGCRLAAQLADGTSLVVERPHAKGDPDDPLDGPEVEAKALALMGWAGVPGDVAARLVAAVGRLVDGGSVADLSTALGAVTPVPTMTS